MPDAAPRTVDLLVTGAGEVLTCAADAPDLIGRLLGGGVAVDAGEIVAVGDVSGYTGRRVLDAAGGVVLPVDVVSTYLGAHAFPSDVEPGRYVDQVIGQIPEVVERGLAEFCDVYCDDGYFDLTQTRRILEAGVDAGLVPKLHLDAYSHTGARSWPPSSTPSASTTSTTPARRSCARWPPPA